MKTIKTIKINLAKCKVYLRTTINTLEVKENRRGQKYIPLSYDIKMNDEDMASYRLKIYLDIDNNFAIDDDFDMNQLEEKATNYIQEFIYNNTLILQERKYMDNCYYTLYKENKGRLQFWNK